MVWFLLRNLEMYNYMLRRALLNNFAVRFGKNLIHLVMNEMVVTRTLMTKLSLIFSIDTYNPTIRKPQAIIYGITNVS